ncbi:MAG: Maf family protein [Spirochaetia bacterium]
MDTIMLISSSPRRQELLKNSGLSFRAVPGDAQEILHEDENPKDAVLRIAHEKLQSFLVKDQLHGSHLVLAADTFVHISGKNFGKPQNREVAAEYLRMLSGRIHQVYTGLVLFSRKANKFFDCVELSEVRFLPLTEVDIEWYLDSGEWQNAAGGYKIQGRAQCLIESMRGSFSSVMGLPMHRLYEILRQLGYSF